MNETELKIADKERRKRILRTRVIEALTRTGPLRWIPKFCQQKGFFFDRVEHLIFSEWWNYPSHATWREVKQPPHNRPYECELRCREMRRK